MRSSRERSVLSIVVLACSAAAGCADGNASEHENTAGVVAAPTAGAPASAGSLSAAGTVAPMQPEPSAGSSGSGGTGGGSPVVVGTGTGQGAGGLDPDGERAPDGGEQELETPDVDCALPAAEVASPLRGGWTGTLHVEQTLPRAGVKQGDFEATLFFGAYAAPQRHMAALGYAGDGWSAYGTPVEDYSQLSLEPLFAAGGDGTAYAFNFYEADGPANEIGVDSSCTGAGESAFVWRYQATFHIADVVDRQLYEYAEPGAPLVTLEAQEVYVVEDGMLRVDASAHGETADGEPIHLHTTGRLASAQ